MLQRLIAALLGVLGVAAAALGVASATAWRADDPLVASVTAEGDGRTLVTDPGVLEMAGDPVTVTVHAGEDPVVLAVGRDTDVDAWIGADPYTRVTGLSDWHTLAAVVGEPPAGTEPAADPTATPTEAVADPSAEPAEAGDQPAVQTADPTGSDLWVVETAGDGTASLRWDAQPGRWSLIAVSLGDTAPTLDLSWPQTVTTPWLWPGVAVGVLLVAVSAILWVRIWRRARLGPDADWHDVSTGMIAAVPRPAAASAARPLGAVDLPPATAGGPASEAPGRTPTAEVPIGSVAAQAPGQPLTRRQIREAEAAAAEARRRGGRRPATGAVPVVPGTPTGQVPVVQPVEADRSTPVRGIPTTPSPAAPRPMAPSPGAPSPVAPSPAAPRHPAAGPAPTDAPTASARPAGTPTAPGSTPMPPTAAPVAPAPAPAPGAAAPVAAPSGAAPNDGPDAAGTSAPTRRRGLGALLGRRGRGGESPTPPDAPAPTTEPPAPAPRAATSWTPVPGQPTSPVPPGAAPVGPVASGSAQPGPVAAAPGDEDGAARAQRADAWRRMWGFNPEGTAPTQDAPPTDPAARPTDRPTQEDR